MRTFELQNAALHHATARVLLPANAKIPRFVIDGWKPGEEIRKEWGLEATTLVSKFPVLVVRDRNDIAFHSNIIWDGAAWKFEIDHLTEANGLGDLYLRYIACNLGELPYGKPDTMLTFDNILSRLDSFVIKHHIAFEMPMEELVDFVANLRSTLQIIRHSIHTT